MSKKSGVASLFSGLPEKGLLFLTLGCSQRSKRKRGRWMELGAQTGRYRFVRIRKLLSHGKRTRKRKVERQVSSLVSQSRAFYFWPWDAVKGQRGREDGEWSEGHRPEDIDLFFIWKLLPHSKRTRKRKVERQVSSLVSLCRAFYFWPWDAVKEEERTVNGARSTDLKTSICLYKEIAFSRQTYSETKSGEAEASLFSCLPEQGLLFLALRCSQRSKRKRGRWMERGAQTGRYRFVLYMEIAFSRQTYSETKSGEASLFSCLPEQGLLFLALRCSQRSKRKRGRWMERGAQTGRYRFVLYMEIASSQQTYSETKSGEASLFSGLPEQGLLFLALRCSQRGREDGEWSEEHRPEDIDLFV